MAFEMEGGLVSGGIQPILKHVDCKAGGSIRRVSTEKESDREGLSYNHGSLSSLLMFSVADISFHSFLILCRHMGEMWSS